MNFTGVRTFVFVACWLVSFSSARAADVPATPTEEVAVPAASPERANEPAAPGELVALDLWAVTLHTAKDVVQDDRFGPLIARVENQPTVIGDRDDARSLLKRLKDQGVIRRLQTFRLSTRSGYKGQIVRADKMPMVTGMAQTTFGQTNDIQFQPAGTSVQLMPTVVNGDEIQVDIQFERSDVKTSDDVALARPKDGAPTLAQYTTSSTISTTATLKSGEAVAIALASDTEEEGSTLLILSAETVARPTVGKSAEAHDQP